MENPEKVWVLPDEEKEKGVVEALRKGVQLGLLEELVPGKFNISDDFLTHVKSATKLIENNEEINKLFNFVIKVVGLDPREALIDLTVLVRFAANDEIELNKADLPILRSFIIFCIKKMVNSGPGYETGVPMYR